VDGREGDPAKVGSYFHVPGGKYPYAATALRINTRGHGRSQP